MIYLAIATREGVKMIYIVILIIIVGAIYFKTARKKSNNAITDEKLKELILESFLGNSQASDLLSGWYANNIISSDRMLPLEITVYEQLGSQGNIEAQKRLGFMYNYYLKNNEASLKWYMKAAEGGDTEAMKSIALKYVSDDGYGENPEKKNEWWLKAANLGDGEAQRQVGIGYLFGSGSYEKDLDKAVDWFKKAIKSGDKQALNELAEIYRGHPSVVGKYHNPNEAEQLYLTAIESHNQDACENAAVSLGMIYGAEIVFDNPGSTPKLDPHKALYWFYQAYFFDDEVEYYKEYIRKIVDKTGIQVSEPELQQWYQDYLKRR